MFQKKNSVAYININFITILMEKGREIACMPNRKTEYFAITEKV